MPSALSLAVPPPIAWWTPRALWTWLIGDRAEPTTKEVWQEAGRMTLAGVASFLLAELLHLPAPYWAVIGTFMIARTKPSGTAQALVNRLVGMALGVAVGMAVVLTRRWHVPDPVLIAAAALPTCLLVARFKKFQSAPITAMIVLSVSTAYMTALHGALLRVAAIGLGGAVGAAASALALRWLPAADAEPLAQALTGLGELMASLVQQRRASSKDRVARQRIQAALRPGRAGAGSQHRVGMFLPRLLADIGFIGQALSAAQPSHRPAAQQRLSPCAAEFAAVCTALGRHLRGDGEPPCLATFDAVVDQMRTGLTGDGSFHGDEACMALPFLLTRLQLDLHELAVPRAAAP